MDFHKFNTARNTLDEFMRKGGLDALNSGEMSSNPALKNLFEGLVSQVMDSTKDDEEENGYKSDDDGKADWNDSLERSLRAKPELEPEPSHIARFDQEVITVDLIARCTCNKGCKADFDKDIDYMAKIDLADPQPSIILEGKRGSLVRTKIKYFTFSGTPEEKKEFYDRVLAVLKKYDRSMDEPTRRKLRSLGV